MRYAIIETSRPNCFVVAAGLSTGIAILIPLHRAERIMYFPSRKEALKAAIEVRQRALFPLRVVTEEELRGRMVADELGR